MAKASALSLRSLGICSSFQAEKLLNFCLAKEAYLAIRGSLDSNSALICPTTSCESLWIIRLPTPTMRASSIPVIKASYSNSLLEASKPKQTTCSIFSPIGEVNCRPIPDPDCLEAPSMQRVHQPRYSGVCWAAGVLQGSRPRLVPSWKASACIVSHTC